MCLFAVVTQFHKDFDFLLLFNRDEFYARPSSPPRRRHMQQQQDDDQQQVLLYCPRDEVGGGTWIGFNATIARIVALTNVRSSAPTTLTNDRKIKSRGELVMNVLLGAPDTNTDKDMFDDDFYNYHLIQTDLEQKELSVHMVTCAPPDYKPKHVAYKNNNMKPSKEQKKPWVATKSNDHAMGLTTTSILNQQDENCWPKAVWLRNQVEKVLSENEVEFGDGAGLECAKALVEELEPFMSATKMDGEYGENAANVIPSRYNPLSPQEERILAKAPFLMPFPFEENQWYGTVSQSVLLYSKSEQCLYYAYRNTKQPPIDTSPMAVVTPTLPEWTWERIASQESAK